MSLDKIATDASYTVNVTVFSIGAYTINDLMMLLSIMFGLCTVLISWYYKRREDKRQSEKHELDMSSIERQTPKVNDNETETKTM